MLVFYDFLVEKLIAESRLFFLLLLITFMF